jgi:hypothetical protein
MALGTLAEIRTAALGPRTDMVSRFADFIALAEQRMYYGGNGVPPLRVLPMEYSEPVTFASGVAPLPASFLDKRALYVTDRPEALSYEPPSVFYPMAYDRRGMSFPVAYTIEANSLKISPESNATANLLYYRRLATPTADADTNDILTRYPGVYLFGTQVELYRELRNPDEMQRALQMYADAVQAANNQAMIARTFGGPVRKRLMGLGV